MRRLLLVSTTALGLAALPALAQQTQPAPAPEQPAEAAIDAPTPAPVPEQATHQVRAQSLLGVGVSNGEATIGEVADLVVTEDGRVEAIVVGVGGFLGLGQKRVALAWDSVRLTEQEGERVFLVSATREELEAMPEFKTLEQQEAEAEAAAAAAAAQQQQMQQQPGVVPPAAAPAPGVTPTPVPQPGAQ